MTQQYPPVTVKRRGPRILLVNEETRMGLDIVDYERALEFAKVMRYMARGVYGPARTHVDRQTTIRREHDDIVLEYSNTVFAILHISMALDIGNIIQGHAKLIEEEANAEDVSMDQAILIRQGLGLPMGNSQAILDEAYKEAQYGNIRKYMPAPNKWPKIGRIQVKKEQVVNDNG